MWLKQTPETRKTKMFLILLCQRWVGPAADTEATRKLPVCLPGCSEAEASPGGGLYASLHMFNFSFSPSGEFSGGGLRPAASYPTSVEEVRQATCRMLTVSRIASSEPG